VRQVNRFDVYVKLSVSCCGPTPADTPHRYFLTGVITPVSESLGMYLQADKPFSSSSFHIIPPEELSAPAAEHEAAPEGPIKR
jgi:hypothetical protein